MTGQLAPHPNFIPSPDVQPTGCICAWTWATDWTTDPPTHGMARNGPVFICPVGVPHEPTAAERGAQ